ncbi:competence protein ComK [Bacillus sp. FJAT-45037]|uniref:competence protein ComK n=1 Tax=Bacillus sp. FJAT-45037 TaxID=2011007 RepID=UPI000C23359A|nr:competence protein ComK [Bacillus sp. FJAT-45037]
MHRQILETYEISTHTIAIMPAYDIECETLVLEGHQTLYVKETAIQMIKRACIEGGATYDGRRQAVSELTRAQNKIPIPINTTSQIYAFPTHSPTHLECVWLFYHHIKSFHPHPFEPAKTIVQLYNNNPLTIDISYPSFERQMQRTSYCMVKLSYQASYHTPQLFHPNYKLHGAIHTFPNGLVNQIPS